MRSLKPVKLSPIIGLVSFSVLLSVSIGVGLAHESKNPDPDPLVVLQNPEDDKPQLSQSSSDDDDLLSDDDDLLADDDDLLADDDGELVSDDEDLLADDDLLTDDDEDLLTGEEEDVAADEEAPSEGLTEEEAFEAHAAIFTEDIYPSANACAACHPQHYEEWSVSQHAYAQLSPIYMAMQTTINLVTSVTNGDFCIRCHNQVGMNLGENIFISNLDRAPASREGITCVVCHRLPQSYGKVSGRYSLFEGDIYEPVYGPAGNEELERVLSKPEEYRVVTDRDAAGRAIHTESKKFFQITTSSFCATCHDVTLLNGFRLEEAFAEYHQSPASADGVSCQDCHMGKVQGVKSGYAEGPAAVVGGVPTATRKLTNHFFAGPDYSVIHPGIFPHNVEAAEFKTLREWLQFDHEAGWGTDAFEDAVADDHPFPEAWQSIDDRYDAREILNVQFERLEWAEEKRLEVLRNGFGIGEITIDRADEGGLGFTVEVRNLTDGHGVPTGFDAERLIWLQVTVTDADGNVVYVSGDRDPNGDVRDAHSSYVHNGELPLDDDLFNLQSKFVVRLFRGGEREQVLAVNESVSVLPFVRPERRATTIYGRPLGARKHKKTIEPLGYRTASYDVDEDELTGSGTYDVSVKLISQMVPVNLLTAIQVAGFDYGMSPREIGDAVVAGAALVDERRLKIDLSTGRTEEVKLSEVVE